MPCDSVITNTVALGQLGDYDLLERALLKASYGNMRRYGTTFTFYVGNNRVTLNGESAQSSMDREGLNKVVSDIKRAYSRAAIHEAADQFGWLVEQGEDEDNFVIVKN